jgi:hypothetical protein
MRITSQSQATGSLAQWQLTNKDTEEVKQYIEECEKDKVARDGLRNFFGHKGIL